MDDFMKLASMEYGISPLPENPVPAMAYVPYQQLEAVYGVEQGLMAGTIFPVLDKALGYEIHNVGRILIADRQARTADLISCLVDMGASVLCGFVAAPRLISAAVLSGFIPCHIA